MRFPRSALEMSVASMSALSLIVPPRRLTSRCMTHKSPWESISLGRCPIAGLTKQTQRVCRAILRLARTPDRQAVPVCEHVCGMFARRDPWHRELVWKRSRKGPVPTWGSYPPVGSRTARFAVGCAGLATLERKEIGPRRNRDRLSASNTAEWRDRWRDQQATRSESPSRSMRAGGASVRLMPRPSFAAPASGGCARSPDR